MNYFLILGLIVLGYMTLWYFVSLIKQRNDVADIAWGLGFVVVSWSALLLTHNNNIGNILVSVLVTIWGLRLSIHIYYRNKGKGEDYRYLAWRAQWGHWFTLRSYLQVYVLQGALLYIIALPVLVLHTHPFLKLNIAAYLGVCVWCIGFFFETRGDAQLARFIKDPNNKGKILKTGLWAYSRHPNYFGEVLGWWGIWLFCFSATSLFATIIGPLTITFLILKVSGIPLLEAKMSTNPDFQEYKKHVSVFIPLPPRENYKTNL